VVECIQKIAGDALSDRLKLIKLRLNVSKTKFMIIISKHSIEH
jgi:hypothetical protein